VHLARRAQSSQSAPCGEIRVEPARPSLVHLRLATSPAQRPIAGGPVLPASTSAASTPEQM
jgi:hypothetical protein